MVNRFTITETARRNLKCLAVPEELIESLRQAIKNHPLPNKYIHRGLVFTFSNNRLLKVEQSKPPIRHRYCTIESFMVYEQCGGCEGRGCPQCEYTGELQVFYKKRSIKNANTKRHKKR